MPDIISTLNPRSTPISYPEANERNRRGQERHDQDPERAGRAYIPEYKPDSYITKGPPNPQGSELLGHAHKSKKEPASSDWLFSKQEAQEKYIPGREGAQFLQNLLDLPEEPKYTSDAKTGSGEYIVELSFTFSGAQQAKVPLENTTYSNTWPLRKILNWLTLKR